MTATTITTTATPAQLPAWVAYFGFNRTPFGKDIAPADLVVRDAHAEAVARIRFCIDEAALGVICGEVGAGKTVALRAAVATLDRTRYHVIYIPNPIFGPRGLYAALVTALGAKPRFHKQALMAQAAELLAAETNERNRRVVVIFDEAHLCSSDQFEEIRLCTNDAMDSRSLLAGILVGQPTLARALRMGNLAALDQRIAARYTLTAMTLEESAGYLRHHCQLAGRNDAVFADDAISRLHRATNGVPRALNNAARSALYAAAAGNHPIVDDACAKRAVAELERD